MDVATITMPSYTARRAFLEYRNAVRGAGNLAPAADVALMHSYRALSLGKRILNLYDVMRVAGVDEQNRPHLAVCRADIARVNFDTIWRNHGFVPVFGDWTGGYGRGKIVFPANTFPNNVKTNIFAQVPIIPPRLRPKHALRNYHLLWEADWNAPPRDPILLKRVHGLLFAVLAQWDLTDLERSVLGLVRNADE